MDGDRASPEVQEPALSVDSVAVQADDSSTITPPEQEGVRAEILERERETGRTQVHEEDANRAAAESEESILSLDPIAFRLKPRPLLTRPQLSSHPQKILSANGKLGMRRFTRQILIGQRLTRKIQSFHLTDCGSG